MGGFLIEYIEYMENHTKTTLKTYWSFAKKRKLVFVVLGTSIIANTINLIPPLFYKRLFDQLNLGAPLEMLFHTLSLVALFYLIDWVFWRTAAIVWMRVQPQLMADLDNYCFEYLHKHSVNFFNNNFVGALVKRVNRFVGSFSNISDRIIWNFSQIIITIVFILGVLATRSWYLPAIMLVWFVIFGTLNYWLIRKKMPLDLDKSQKESALTARLADTIANHTALKFFNGYHRETAAYKEGNHEVTKAQWRAYNLDGWFDAGQAFLMYCLEIGMMSMALVLWKQDKVTLGDFALIQAFLITLFLRIWDLGRMIRDTYTDMAYANEMTEILQTPHAIQDAPNAKEWKKTAASIHWDQVDFGYNKTNPLIKNLNLEIKAGERVALVGPSGAGKSTLLKLIMRQYDTLKGAVKIGGQDIKTITQESLWRVMSYVPQDPVLFHRSILENIRYARPEATEAEVISAAKSAHCHEFIEALPAKYETLVGERGVKLSGGERQRVAIARAILRDAPILLLDEATSSLDSESERLIQDALDTLMIGKTVVVIAHRLSTIMRMDRIVVIDGGQVKESGAHAELVAKPDGLYRKLWELQVGGFLSEPEEQDAIA